MKRKNRLETLIYLATLLALATFEALFFVVVSADHFLWVALLCLAMDAVLLAVFFQARRSNSRAEALQFGEVSGALKKVLDLTRTQHSSWVTMLDGLTTLQPEEQLNLTSLGEVLEAVDDAKNPLAQTAQGTATIESMIDAIQTFILVDQGLMSDLGKVLRFYSEAYDKFQRVRTENDLNHFRLNETVDFLGKMGTASSSYSEKLVLEVLESFREITRSTEQIGTEVAGTMHRLMDSTNEEGLDAINHQSGTISATMDGFFGELEAAISYSRKTVQENLAQIERVKVMAEAISEFSESIRMISLNLNIEAARVGQSGSSAAGRGFKVLATKLSEFALKAQELAKQQTDIIASASEVISASSGHETELLGGLLQKVPAIQAQLTPFRAIIGNAFERFEGVEKDMSRLTVAIDSKLKAVIGRLQFQDLVRQEQDHVLAMFSRVRDEARGISDVNRPLTAEQESEARQKLIYFFERMASTENELAVIRGYRKAHAQQEGTGAGQDNDDAVSAGSVNLF
ncbi:MAG: hypothetical protein WCG80_06920 [Spirochaetales bacterium]